MRRPTPAIWFKGQRKKIRKWSQRLESTGWSMLTSVAAHWIPRPSNICRLFFVLKKHHQLILRNVKEFLDKPTWRGGKQRQQRNDKLCWQPKPKPKTLNRRRWGKLVRRQTQAWTFGFSWQKKREKKKSTWCQTLSLIKYIARWDLRSTQKDSRKSRDPPGNRSVCARPAKPQYTNNQERTTQHCTTKVKFARRMAVIFGSEDF